MSRSTRLTAVVTVMCVLLAMTAVSVHALHATTSSATALFEEFKHVYQRAYDTVHEEQLRLRNFERNLEIMEMYQEMNPYAEFGVTEFFDLSEEEFHRLYLSGEAYYEEAAMLAEHQLKTVSADPSTAPIEKDWRTEGAVTPVKNQGSCGSCWAFSAVGNIEGQWMLSGHPLTQLSEQQLVSCDKVDHACHGGLMLRAYDWLIHNANGNVYTEESYPYTSGGAGVVPACNWSSEKRTGATVQGHVSVKRNESVMAAYLAGNGPLAIAIDATAFHSYRGGIITECSGTRINHGVLLVGYNMTDGDVPYWIIKNSWGTRFGEKGYVRIRMFANECLINSYVVSAKVAKETNPPVTTTTTTTTTTGAPRTMLVEHTACVDFSCHRNCTMSRVPVDECRTGKNGESFMLECGRDQVLQRSYTSTDCSGLPKYTVTPSKQCMTAWWGSFTDACVYA